MDSKLAAFDSAIKTLVDSCSTKQGMTDASALNSAVEVIHSARAAVISELAGGLNKLQLCEVSVATCGMACGSTGAVCLLPFSRLRDLNTTSLALLDAGLDRNQLELLHRLQQQLAETCANTRGTEALVNARAVVYSLESTEDEAAAALQPLQAEELKLVASCQKLTAEAISTVKPEQLGVLSRWGWGREALGASIGSTVLLKSTAELSTCCFGKQMPRKNPLNATQLVHVKTAAKMDTPVLQQQEVMKVLTHVQAVEVARTKLRLMSSCSGEGDKISALLRSSQEEARQHLSECFEGDHAAQLKAIEFARAKEVEIQQ